jgi:hypothetical protein
MTTYYYKDARPPYSVKTVIAASIADAVQQLFTLGIRYSRRANNPDDLKEDQHGSQDNKRYIRSHW